MVWVFMLMNSSSHPKVSWGKLAKDQVCYQDVLEKPEHAGYLGWSRAPLTEKSRKGAALDFARYRAKYDKTIGFDKAQKLIAGTNLVRTYKKD